MKRLYKDQWNKKLGGVCGGLGQYLNIDPSLVRLAFVATCILTAFFPVIIAYIVLWFIMPEGPKHFVEPKYKAFYRSKKDKMVGGVCGGIAKLTKVDSTVIRLAYVVACIATGVFPLLFAYIAAVCLVPEDPTK